MSSRSVSWRGFSATVELPDKVAGLLRTARRLASPQAAGRLVIADPTPSLSLTSPDPGYSAEYFRTWFRHAEVAKATSDPSDLDPDTGSCNLRARVAELAWYHTLDLGHDIVTPGLFDHRPLLPHYGLPHDMTGARTLDVATFDGFWAFELERRGADVVAIDIPRLSSTDMPPQLRAEILSRGYDADSGTGFHLAHRALHSSVERMVCSVYDLDPNRMGMFDLVHAADLLIHLQSPVTALQRIRSVTRGRAMIVDVFDPNISPKHGQAVHYKGGWWSAIWWIPSLNALAQMVLDAGFSSVSLHKVYNLAGTDQRDGLWRAIIMAEA